MKRLFWMLLIPMIAGCSQEPTRDPMVDSKRPVVNPLAPGARSGVRNHAAITGGLYTATPGMKTGIPK
jgi:hypothetical protein